MKTPYPTPGTAVAGASVIAVAVRGVIKGATLGHGGRRRRTAPTSRVLGFAPSGPAAPADRLLGNLRLSG